jgi:hypothetical protein
MKNEIKNIEDKVAVLEQILEDQDELFEEARYILASCLMYVDETSLIAAEIEEFLDKTV